MPLNTHEDQPFEDMEDSTTSNKNMIHAVQQKLFEMGISFNDIRNADEISNFLNNVQTQNEDLSDDELIRLAVEEAYQEITNREQVATVKTTLRSRFTSWVKTSYEKVKTRTKETIKRQYQWFVGPRRYMRKMHRKFSDFNSMTSKLIVGFEKWVGKMEKYIESHYKSDVKKQHLLKEIKAQKKILDDLKSNINNPAQNLDEMDTRISQIISKLEVNITDPNETIAAIPEQTSDVIDPEKTLNLELDPEKTMELGVDPHQTMDIDPNQTIIDDPNKTLNLEFDPEQTMDLGDISEQTVDFRNERPSVIGDEKQFSNLDTIIEPIDEDLKEAFDTPDEQHTLIENTNQDPNQTLVVDEDLSNKTIAMSDEEQEAVAKNSSEGNRPPSDNSLEETRKFDKMGVNDRTWMERVGVGVLFAIDDSEHENGVLGQGGMGKTIKLQSITEAEDNPFLDPNHPRFTDINHPDYIGRVTFTDADGCEQTIIREVTESDIRNSIEKSQAVLSNLKRPVLGGAPGETDEVPCDEPIVLKVVTIPGQKHMNRMYQEGRTMQQLSHPNIAQMYHVTWEFSVAQDQFQFMHLMEYIEGRDLKKTFEENPPSIEQILDISTQFCDGLAHAHERGIVHRDIKPDNIMLKPDGTVKIIDFGVSKSEPITPQERAELRKLGIEWPEEEEGMIVGTLSYMPPEQIQGQIDQITPAADIYAYGATLYHLLTGKPVVEGNTICRLAAKIISEKPVPPRELNKDIPEELEKLILQMLEKNPQNRPQSMTEVKNMITKIQATQETEVVPLAA